MTTEKFFFGLVAFFLLVYLLRTLLMVGYAHYKYRNKSGRIGEMLLLMLKHFISLKPVLQKRLEPKGYDYKVYQRFQNRFAIYYVALWISLFLILFLGSKLYLGVF